MHTASSTLPSGYSLVKGKGRKRPGAQGAALDWRLFPRGRGGEGLRKAVLFMAKGIQFKFLGTFPGGVTSEMRFVCRTAAPETDGVVVLAPTINLAYRPHVQLLVAATAALAAAGCQHISVHWACPF